MKKLIFVSVIVVVLFGGYYGVNAIFTRDLDIPIFDVRRGEFLLSLKVSGEVDASRAYVISAPRIRSRNLQITWLAPEGSRIKKVIRLLSLMLRSRTRNWLTIRLI